MWDLSVLFFQLLASLKVFQKLKKKKRASFGASSTLRGILAQRVMATLRLEMVICVAVVCHEAIDT